MAVRDLFGAVDRPVVQRDIKPENATDFRTRWAELAALVTARWGQAKLYWLEMKLSMAHELIAASKDATNAAWSTALGDLQDAPQCPHNICAWMANAVRRAIEAEKHQPPEHRADDGEVAGRRDRAYRRIADRRAGAT